MAIKSQGALLKIETARATAKPISGATAANPVVVTATAHGYANGDIIYIDGVVGMTQLNGRVFVCDGITANTVNLKGIDGTGYTAYTSGGSAYKLTMTAIGQVRDVDMSGGQADDIDVTHLQSVAKEYLVGLMDMGDASFNLWLDNTDTGQAAIRTAQLAQATKGFTLTASDTKIACFPGLIKQYGFTMAANGAAEGKCTVKVSAAWAPFA